MPPYRRTCHQDNIENPRPPPPSDYIRLFVCPACVSLIVRNPVRESHFVYFSGLHGREAGVCLFHGFPGVGAGGHRGGGHVLHSPHVGYVLHSPQRGKGSHVLHSSQGLCSPNFVPESKGWGDVAPAVSALLLVSSFQVRLEPGSMDAQRRHIGSNVPLIDQGEEQEDHEVGECAEFTTRGHVDVVGDDVRQVSDPSDLEAMCRSTDSVHVADFWDGIVFTVPRMEEESLDAIQEPDDMTSDGKPSRFQAVPVPEDQLENTSSGDSIQDPRMCSELGDDTHMRIDDVIQSTCARMPSGSAMRAPPVPGLLPKTLSFADPSTYQTLRYETVDDPSDDTGSGLSGSGSDVTSQRRESSDSSSYYDTVSSTSSTAALLQKVKVTPQVKIEVIECETSLPQQVGHFSYFSASFTISKLLPNSSKTPPQ